VFDNKHIIKHSCFILESTLAQQRADRFDIAQAPSRFAAWRHDRGTARLARAVPIDLDQSLGDAVI
jgi:hypothetical protein